jgi:hypothetical protein
MEYKQGDLANEIVAKRIIELAKAGELNPDLLCGGVLKGISRAALVAKAASVATPQSQLETGDLISGCCALSARRCGPPCWRPIQERPSVFSELRSQQFVDGSSHARQQLKETAMRNKVLLVATAVGLMFGTTTLCTAQGAQDSAPGQKMQDKGSVRGQPGASGYAPGQRMQDKGSKAGQPGASGYAPGQQDSTSGQGARGGGTSSGTSKTR